MKQTILNNQNWNSGYVFCILSAIMITIKIWDLPKKKGSATSDSMYVIYGFIYNHWYIKIRNVFINIYNSQHSIIAITTNLYNNPADVSLTSVFSSAGRIWRVKVSLSKLGNHSVKATQEDRDKCCPIECKLECKLFIFIY